MDEFKQFRTVIFSDVEYIYKVAGTTSRSLIDRSSIIEIIDERIVIEMIEENSRGNKAQF